MYIHQDAHQDVYVDIIHQDAHQDVYVDIIHQDAHQDVYVDILFIRRLPSVSWAHTRHVLCRQGRSRG